MLCCDRFEGGRVQVNHGTLPGGSHIFYVQVLSHLCAPLWGKDLVFTAHVLCALDQLSLLHTLCHQL